MHGTRLDERTEKRMRKQRDATRVRPSGAGTTVPPMAQRARRAGGAIVCLAVTFGLVIAISAPANTVASDEQEVFSDEPGGVYGSGENGASSGASSMTGKTAAREMAALILKGETKAALESRGCSFVGSRGILEEGFEDEVVGLAGFDEVMVSAEQRVVGFCCPGSASRVFASLRASLEGGGWTGVESGSDTLGSFVKEGGRFSWVFIVCYQIGEEVSVVMQYR